MEMAGRAAIVAVAFAVGGVAGWASNAVTDDAAPDALASSSPSDTDSATIPADAIPAQDTSNAAAIDVEPVEAPVASPSTTPATFLPADASIVAAGLGTETFDLPGCPDSERGAVTDKDAQRYWLCMNGTAVTDEIPMTTASGGYGLPPVGTYDIFAREADAFGIGGEPLERFVAFYTTPKGNRIAFHEVVDQDPDTVGDLDQRGSSAGCFRVREPDSVQVWEFLRIGDPVVVLT